MNKNATIGKEAWVYFSPTYSKKALIWIIYSISFNTVWAPGRDCLKKDHLKNWKKALFHFLVSFWNSYQAICPCHASLSNFNQIFLSYTFRDFYLKSVLLCSTEWWLAIQLALQWLQICAHFKFGILALLLWVSFFGSWFEESPTYGIQL